jgi:tartrate dehydrogenase/decarboxylase/D-malate dehydrogenase
LAGSLGIAASANLNPERTNPSMFEPVHGSAPDIAGQGIANPIGAIWSVVLMLEHLGLARQAHRVWKAITDSTAERQVTPDLGGTLSTAQVGAAIRARLDG